MLETTEVEQVRQLLAAGWSQREAARKVGVSRGSVHAIATGKRTLRENPDRNPDEDELAIPRGPWKRCPQCGGKVMMPCLACQVRHFRDRPAGDSAADRRTSLSPIPSPRDHRGESAWDLEGRRAVTDTARKNRG